MIRRHKLIILMIRQRSSKEFKSKLRNKAEAAALAFTYDPDLYDDDDDDDDKKVMILILINTERNCL